MRRWTLSLAAHVHHLSDELARRRHQRACCARIECFFQAEDGVGSDLVTSTSTRHPTQLLLEEDCSHSRLAYRSSEREVILSLDCLDGVDSASTVDGRRTVGRASSGLYRSWKSGTCARRARCLARMALPSATAASIRSGRSCSGSNPSLFSTPFLRDQIIPLRRASIAVMILFR